MFRCFNILLFAFLIVFGPAAVIAKAAPPEIQTEILKSKVLDEDRKLYIALPADYSPDRAYPVVYHLDGGTKYTPAMAEGMQSANPGLIVVGIGNVDRSRDMFPHPLKSKMNRGGGAAKFLEFIKMELIPYVDEKYSTDGFRIISGQSNSAFFVLYTMLSSPDAFDAYLASSPMIGWDWEMIEAGTTGLLHNKDSWPKALYMNQGGTDYEKVTQYLPRYVDLLKKIAPADFRWMSETIEDSGHVPEISFKNGIVFIFSGQKAAVTR